MAIEHFIPPVLAVAYLNAGLCVAALAYLVLA